MQKVQLRVRRDFMHGTVRCLSCFFEVVNRVLVQYWVLYLKKKYIKTPVTRTRITRKPR